jgi:hypothetical protein
MLALWEQELGADESAYVPLVPLQPIADRLLIVGLNPSFNPEAIHRLLLDHVVEPAEYFSWANRGAFDANVDILLHERAKQNYPYFRSYQRIAAALSVDWDHLDLFFWRETSQRQFRERILVNGSVAELTAFGRTQLEISVRMIESARPVAIIIANALASDIYLANRNPKFSPERGCYEDMLGGRRIPIFLSSMLSGQRALDKHSLKRLRWHIGRELGRTVDYNKEGFGE